MDVTQATGSGGLLNPKVRIKEEDPGDPDAGEGKEGAAPPKMVGRSWEEVGRKVKEEPEEEPSGNWDARLQAFLKTLHSPHSTGGTPPLPERKGGKDPKRPPAPSQGMAGANKWPEGQWVSPNQPRCVGKAEQGEETPLEASRRGEKETEGLLAEDAAGAERQCRRFRTLCYDDAAGPRELCGQLLELCRQWLKPERHTKEQMVELVTLEQFLAILPLEMQSWLRQNDPVTCAEAVTLAEDFLLSRQEARDWERQVLGISEEEPSQHLPEVKIHLFEETKQEGEESVGLLTRGGWPRQSEEEQRLPGSPEKTERVTLLKTDQEDDSLSRGDPEENKMGLKGQNGTDEEDGEDPPVHPQEATCKEAGKTAVQLDERLQGHEGGEAFVPGSELPGRERSPGEEVKCYKCWHCGQSFGSSSELLLHERNHVGEQLYKCSHCGGSERVHMGRKPRKCSHCGNTFGCNPQQETNGETKLHTCSECGEKYIHVSGLARHQKTHRGEKAYKCLKCGENFGAYSGLRAHWRTHTGENQYKCLQCEMCFSGITRLRAHEKVHMAVCSSCGKNFSQKSELIEHERTHARENSFVCLDCGKAFGFHSELVAHVRTHRDKKLECPDSKNTLICSECGDTFRHSSALKAHQRVHKGEHKREQQDHEESAERPREIKREPEEEAPPSEEPRKKQKLTMETRIGRAAATEATTTQSTAMAAASEAEAATEGAGAEAAAMAVVKIEVADEMSEAHGADEEEPPHQEEEAERQPAGTVATATQPPVPWFGFEDAVTSLSQKGKNLIVQGNYCLPAVKKLNSGITSSASHVDQHLKKADPEKLRDILDLKQGRRSMYSEDSPEEEEKKEEEEEESPTAVQSKRPALETVTQKMLDRTLVDYVVEEMVPVQTVDRPAFVALVRLGLPSGLKILRPQALRERIEEKAAVMKEALASRMRAAEYVATTADCWREGRKSFLGVTAHWISPTTLKREFGALACRRLKGGLTYSVLAKALRDVHLQFGIDGKVVCATTDNGSPFVEAFRAFEAQELREAEGGDGDEDENDDREAPEVEFVPISEILDAGDNGKGQEEAGSAGLPPHQRCASYTLNLIATRDVEAMISDAPETSPLGLFGKHFRSLLRKCGQLWSKQKRSAETAEYVYRQCGDYLKTPDGSRWSAVFEALKQLHRLLSAAPLKMDAVMERCALARFTSEERVALQEYTEALAPLSLSLDILQRENNVFMGYLLPTVYSLDRKFQGLENKPAPSVYTLPLLRGLRQALRKRFAPVWEDKQLLLAACLHPRFKLDWLESSKSAQTNRFAMEALLNAELKGPVSEAGDDSLEKEEEGDDILLDFFDIQPRRRASAVDPGEEELSKYLVNPSREVSSLLAFPIIRQSFLKYNTGLPSSAAAERLFGTDGNLMTARRRSLPDDVFEQLVLLRQNRVSPALS